MKTFLTTLLLSITLTFSWANMPKKETITIKTTIYCDHCLECNSCGLTIDDAIREKNNGISKVKINPKNNTITVTYKTKKTNPAEIRKAISEAGFDADEVKASPNGYAKLDGCCKAK